MINDRHMANGDWSIQLRDDTPWEIRSEFRAGSASNRDNWRSFVCFLENDVHGLDGTSLTQAVKEAFAANVLWTGPVWRRGDKMRSFGGPSLMGFLGNSRGSAFKMAASGHPSFPATISQIITGWFGSGAVFLTDNGITEGTSYSPTTATVDQMVYGSYLPPVKGPLDTMMVQTGNEYRIRPDGAIDWGVATSLFRSSPTVFVAEQMSGVTDAFHTLDVPLDGITVKEDIDGLRNAARVYSKDFDIAAGTGTAGVTTLTTLGPDDISSWSEGDKAYFCGPFTKADTNDVSDVTALSQAAADLYGYTNREIRVVCNDRCVLGYVTPGDWVNVWAPEDGVFDSTREITTNGRTINPEKIRVVAVRQPFTPGMGAYVVRYLGAFVWNITRITDYIVPENQPTQLELGYPPAPTVQLKFQSVLKG